MKIKATPNLESDGHKRWATLQYRDLVVMERVPLHLLTNKEHLMDVAKKLQIKLEHQVRLRYPGDYYRQSPIQEDDNNEEKQSE